MRLVQRRGQDSGLLLGLVALLFLSSLGIKFPDSNPSDSRACGLRALQLGSLRHHQILMQSERLEGQQMQ